MPPAPRSRYPNLPKYVTVANGRVVYRPVIPPEKRHLIKTDRLGKLTPPVRLGKDGDPEAQILRAYLAAKDEVDAKLAGNPKFTLYWLRDEFHASRQFTELSAKTQKEYLLLSRLLDHDIKFDDRAAHLGDVMASSLTTPMLRKLFDRRLTNYQEAGKKGTAMVNRERAWLSAMLSWGLQYIDGLGLLTNPCKGIKRAKEQAIDRYVPDHEYEAQAEVAAELYAYMPVVYELLYLCAARGVEATDLHKNSPKERGLEVDRRKGSEDNGILWTPRLRAAVDAALAMHRPGKVQTTALLVNLSGERLTKSAIDSAQQRIKAEMERRGLGHIYWNLHLLKAKGLSDAKNKRIAGHKSEAMQRRYDRLKNWVEPPR
jgi:hypothetical protein